jgi:hypothetical protein
MTPSGSIAPALLHVRAALAATLEPFGWKVSTAENPFQKLNALAAVGAGGICVVSWAGDRKQDQAGRSLVIRASISVSLAAKQDLLNPAGGKLEGSTPRSLRSTNGRRASCWRCRCRRNVPEPGADAAVYSGSGR